MTPEGKSNALYYKKSHFVTQLPVDYRYSASHAWIARHDQETWRVGLTKFATRMLGEIVDIGFEPTSGSIVKHGQIIGWIEGFKAISDIFCIADGKFISSNSALEKEIELVSTEPYHRGWLYLVTGQPDPRCVDVHAYKGILDQTIDRLLAKQKVQDNP